MEASLCCFDITGQLAKLPEFFNQAYTVRNLDHESILANVFVAWHAPLGED